jgi:opine dehydrogenase
MKETIAIIGGGNGAITMAAELSLRGWPVRLWEFPEFRERSLGAIRELGGIHLRGKVEGFAPLRDDQLPDDVGDALAGAGLVMVIVPAFGHAKAARACAPHLADGQVVVLAPSTGGALEFARVVAEEGGTAVPVAEMHSLIYTCRMVDSVTADLFYIKDHMPIGTFPAQRSDEVMRRLHPLYPQMSAASNVLETSLNNINPVMHVAPTLLNTGRIESTGGDFLFYRESVTPTVGRVMDDMDAERLALCRAAGVEGYSLIDFMREMYLIEGTGSYDLLNRSPAHRSTKAPFGLGHRYVTEDIPYGLVPMLALAERLGVPMPTTRQFTDLAATLTGADYLTEGRTLARLGLDGVSAEGLSAFLTTGGA